MLVEKGEERRGVTAAVLAPAWAKVQMEQEDGVR